MLYVIFNQTSYGDGIYFYGLTRSLKTAKKITDSLSDGNDDGQPGDGYNYKPIDNIDKYDIDALIEHLKEKGEM